MPRLLGPCGRQTATSSREEFWSDAAQQLREITPRLHVLLYERHRRRLPVAGRVKGEHLRRVTTDQVRTSREKQKS